MKNKDQKIYDFEVFDHKKRLIKLSEYKGKVMLIVNVASSCGLAKQSYAELSEILNIYYKKGLRILLFPCKQFLNQEHDDLKKVKEFADEFNTQFILMDLIKVNGNDAHPLFKYLCENLEGFLTNSIKWNFTYFLIGREGELLRRYSPTEHIKDEDPDLLKAIGDFPDEEPSFQPKELINDKNSALDFDDSSSD